VYSDAADGVVCDDVDACTLNDQCRSGVCRGAPECAEVKKLKLKLKFKKNNFLKKCIISIRPLSRLVKQEIAAVQNVCV